MSESMSEKGLQCVFPFSPQSRPIVTFFWPKGRSFCRSKRHGVCCHVDFMNEIAEAHSPRAMSGVTRVERRFEERMRDVNERISEVDRNVQRFVRRKPMTAALIALGAGFLLGRLMSRM